MRKNFGEWLVLGALALSWTAIAWHVWPCWDDAWLWLAGRTLSPRDVALAHGNRPLHGWIEGRMLAAGVTRQLSAILHAGVWFGTGAVTRCLWKRLFPDLPRLAVIAGVVAMSPIFVTTQIVLVNPTWSSSLPALLFWVPFVLLFPMTTANTRTERPIGHPLRVLGIGVGIALLLIGCLLSEYAVAAGLAGATLALFLENRRASARAGARWKMGIGILSVSLVGYALLRSTTHGTVRANAAPLYLVHHLVQRAVSFPFFLATSVWRGTASAVLSRIGGIRIEQAGMERVTSLAAAIGTAALAMTIRWLRGTEDGSAGSDDGRGTSFFEKHRKVIALVLGTAAGLAPFCLTARVPTEDSTSRYFLPVLPILGVLAVALTRNVFRSTRAREVALAVLAGTCAYWTVTNAGASLKDRHRVRAWAHQLAPSLGNGSTLVVFSNATAWPPYTRDYELTARLRLDMPGGAARGEIWASRAVPHSADMMLLPSSSDRAGAPRLAIGWYRTARIEEPLARIIWATVDENGKLGIFVADD